MPDGAVSTLKKSAYEALKAFILSGDLRPGERLGERELTERLGVSRTPLREALNQLERDGLVVSKPRRGYFVLDLDPKAIEDLLDLRCVLDAYAARLAVRRMTDADIEELRGVVRQLEVLERRSDQTTEEIAEEIRAGLRIHEVIARTGGNRLLYETLMGLYDRLSLLIWIEVLWVDEWELTRREHREIVDAIAARDETRAVAAAEAHVQRSRENVLRVARAQSLLQKRPRGLPRLGENDLDPPSRPPTARSRRAAE